MGTVFKGNTSIVTLDLRPFTGIVNMDAKDFAQNMTSLKTIYFPANLVDDRASSTGDFYPYCSGCTALEKAILPHSCKRSHGGQFNIGGTNTTIIFGDPVNGSDLLSICQYQGLGSGIKKLVIYSETPPYWHSVNSASFAATTSGGLPPNCHVYVPDSAVDTYKNSGSAKWGNYAARIHPISEYSEK